MYCMGLQLDYKTNDVIETQVSCVWGGKGPDNYYTIIHPIKHNVITTCKTILAKSQSVYSWFDGSAQVCDKKMSKII